MHGMGMGRSPRNRQFHKSHDLRVSVSDVERIFIYIILYMKRNQSLTDMITLTNSPHSRSDQTNLISIFEDLIVKYRRTDAPITDFFF